MGTTAAIGQVGGSVSSKNMKAEKAYCDPTFGLGRNFEHSVLQPRAVAGQPYPQTVKIKASTTKI